MTVRYEDLVGHSNRICLEILSFFFDLSVQEREILQKYIRTPMNNRYSLFGKFINFFTSISSYWRMIEKLKSNNPNFENQTNTFQQSALFIITVRYFHSLLLIIIDDIIILLMLLLLFRIVKDCFHI